ncbi:MAG: hypothetical protein QOH91_1205 [Mycobacterium sp.]|jgi:hypothetical protein|nr:hypothetical protein [Mycobacterium sp.]
MFSPSAGPDLVTVTAVARASQMRTLASEFGANAVWAFVTGAFIRLSGLTGRRAAPVLAHVEDTLLLPGDMGIVGKQCDTVNDMYDPNTNEIELCYESIEHSEKNFSGSGKADSVTAAVDAETSGFYHELGHATLAIYQLAFTGREEDVADQLSAFTLLNPGADGKPYPNGLRIATYTAEDWKLSAKESGDANELPFWDGHPMDVQRMYNWQCWIYGSNPAANGSIITSGDLPEDRAGNCEDEYQNMTRGWQQLLGPHLRRPN